MSEVSIKAAVNAAEVVLETNSSAIEQIDMKKKQKKLIYYSDGVVEEQSDDEKETIKVKKQEDPKTWPSYIVSVLDHMGEKLAYFFGITSPKYQYAIDEYWRRKKEEEEDREFEIREKAARLERHTRSHEIAVVDMSQVESLTKSNIPVVLCKQPTSESLVSTSQTSVETLGKKNEKVGLVNEGFDDVLKY